LFVCLFVTFVCRRRSSPGQLGPYPTRPLCDAGQVAWYPPLGYTLCLSVGTVTGAREGVPWLGQVVGYHILTLCGAGGFVASPWGSLGGQGGAKSFAPPPNAAGDFFSREHLRGPDLKPERAVLPVPQEESLYLSPKDPGEHLFCLSSVRYPRPCHP
jgi:hypothetical protein